MADFWHGLEGARIETKFVACLHCGGRDGVMLRHHCKDELELYCDWCERWTGNRITTYQVRAWVEAGGDLEPCARRPEMRGTALGSKLSRDCPDDLHP